nr:reverse transcriptase domain-containing protein [Tanacetum cinerariifolium]
MRTRSSLNLPGESLLNPTSSNPKHRNRRCLKQPFILEESPVDTIFDQRTMVELLREPTEDYAKALVVPPILAEHFKLKHSLINMMTSDQFFRLEKDNPHDDIRELKAITTRSGMVLDGPSVSMPPPVINPEEDERSLHNLRKTFLMDRSCFDSRSWRKDDLREGDERLTLKMRHDTSSYSNQPQKESINMINIFNDSCEDFLKDLFATNHLSGNPTFSSHTNLASPEVKDDIFDPKGDVILDSTKDLLPPHNINPLSGSTTSSSSSSPNH